MRKVKVSPSVYLAHAKALEQSNAKYPVRRIICKTFTIPNGNLDFTQESLFSGQLPTRIVVGFVDNDAFNGVFNKNPFNFKHYNLTNIKLYMDGQQQFLKPLTPDFTNNRFIAAYMSLFIATGKYQKDEGTDISREDYSGGYALYCFDLSPDMAENDHFNLTKEGNVRLEGRFSVALPNTVNAVVYAEFENIIEIDRNKNVIFDYTN